MKLFQNELDFKPIVLVFETKKEAKTLLEIVDFFNKDDYEAGIISEEVYHMCIDISDAFTNCEVEIPVEKG